MTRLICILIICVFTFSPHLLKAQFINAGQTSGDYIVYNNIPDIYLSSPYWNSSDYGYIDLNADGSDDLELSTVFSYWSHPDDMSASASAQTLGTLQYSTDPDHPGWIRKHQQGEVIGPSLIWSSGQGIFYGVSSSSGASGNFYGEGYMAFRICDADTIYGWIRIYASASFDGAYITVYDFAYTTCYTGLPAEQAIAEVPVFYVSGNLLLFGTDQTGLKQTTHLSCFDLSGRLVLQTDIGPGVKSIDISCLHDGMYILKLYDESGRKYSGKIVL